MSKTDEKKPKSTDHISHERATSIAGDILKSAAKHKAIADVRQHFAQGGVVDGATSVEPTPEASGPAVDYGQDLVTADNPQASMAAKGMDPLINAAKPTVEKALDFGGNLDNYHAMLKAAMAGNEEAQKGLVDNHLSVAMGSLGAEQPKALKEMIAEGLESSHDLPTLKKNVTSHLENEFKTAIKNADTPETKAHLKDLLSQINKPGSGAVDTVNAVEGTPQSLDQAIANSMKTSDPHHVQDYLAQKFTASQFTAPEGAEDHLENLFNNLSKEPKTLDMSADARMTRAEDMGHTVDAYHGTKADIDEFNPDTLGASTNARSARQGYFFAEDPSTASDYADLSEGRASLRGRVEENKFAKPLEEVREKLAAKYGEKFKTPAQYLEHLLAYTPEDLEEVGIKQVDPKDPLLKELNIANQNYDEATKALYTDPEREISKLELKKIGLGGGGWHRNKDELKKTIVYWKDQLEKYDPNGPVWKKTPEQIEAIIEKSKNQIKTFDSDKTKYIKEYKKSIKEINDKIKEMKALKESNLTGQNVLPVKLKMQNPYIHDFKDTGYRDESYNDIMTKAKEAGHDSVVFKNTYDPADRENRVLQDIYAVFEPHQIRSKFAEFDPKKSKSGKLSYSQGGIVPSQPAVQKFADGGEVSSIQQAVANDPKQPEPFQEQHQDPATTPIYNLRTGQLGTIPHDQVQDAITSGLYAFPKGAEIQVFNPEGTLGTIPPEKATEAFNAKYKYASPDAQREYNFEKEYGEGAGNSAKAFALGLGNTASFGALNQGLVGSGLASSEGLKQLTERHPYADTAGSLGAFALPFAGEAAGLGAGIEGVSAVGRGVTSAVRGALPEATGMAGKVLSSGIAHGAGSAVEGLAYGAGQAVTENALGNPDDVSQSMMAQIGHTGVLGGVLGGILGAGAVAIPAAVTKASETLEKLKSSPIAETILNRIGELADSGFAKASGKDIEDIKFGRENRETLGTEQAPDQVKAAQTTAKYYREHQNAMREASYAAKKDIRPVETEQLLREVNPDKAYTEFQKTSSLMDEAISELRSEPEIYSQEAARELEKYQERFLGSPSRGDILDITDEGLEKGSIHPNDVLPGTPVDAFKSMDDLKQRLDDSLSQSAKSSDPKVIKSRQQIQSVRSAIRTSLENPEIWGEAGARQAEYNAALSERISAEKAFNSKFTTKISKGFKTLPEASDIKFGSYLKQLSTDTPSAKLASIEKTEILARLQKADANLLDQIEQSYKSMPDRVFDKQAINDLAEKALNSKADFEAQASRQAAFDRLQAGSSGVSVGEALGGVGLHTFGVPLPGAGIAVAAHALAINPYKSLQHFAKIESLVQKTNAAIAKGSKSLFQGATQVGEHTAGYLASKLNQGNSYKDYEKKTDALSFIANDPNLLMQKLEKSTDSLHSNAPNISSALQASTATAVSFLKSKIPDIGPQNPYGPKMLPSKSDIAKFNRYYETVENPLGVFKQMKAGMMTAETIETLEAVYPALYNKMQTQVVDTITNIKKPDFNYKMKMQLSMFLGEDLDLGLHSHAIMSNQMAQNAAAAQKAQDDANFVKPTSKALGNLTASERSLTSTQATATRSR